MKAWREESLAPSALARIAIMRQGVVAGKERVLVTFPNGETRRMEPGPSSVISKAVVEDFARRFLDRPGVIWLSESRHQVVARDDELARKIGLAIRPDRNLPDVILVDLGPDAPLPVFVEVVATDGPVNEARRTALMSMAADAGFHEEQVAFVTAYDDRDAGAFRRSVSKLAWRSFVWFMSEPDHVMALHCGSGARQVLLSELMRVASDDG